MTALDDRALMERLDAQNDLASIANVDVEQALIGAVLSNNDAYRRVVEIVKAEHFSEELHRRIWHVVSTLIEKGEVANALTCKTYLGDGDIGGMTAPKYLARLTLEAATIVNAPGYAKTVRDLWLRKELFHAAQEMQRLALDPPIEATIESILTKVEAHLERIRPAIARDADYEEFGIATTRAVDMAATAYQRAGMLVGLSTGLPNLDEALGGLQSSDLIILAGRPAMGKTALGTNIARAVARKLAERRAAGEKTGVVGFSSLEMSAGQLADRIIADVSSVPSFKIRKGYANELEMERYVAAARELNDLPLHIDQTGGLSIASLRTRARSLKKRRGLELLIVDYLQLLVGSGRRDANRVEVVTEITTGLKALAKELDIPIIALSQLSRKVEERDDKRPMLADLRESGSIEQDADVVMFVFREEYYLGKAEPRAGSEAHVDWTRRMHAAAGVATIIVGKNRHGPEASVRLGFQSSYTRFTDEPEPREEMPSGPDREPRKKKVSLPKEATIALGILRSLSITQAIENDGSLPRVPRKVRPVDYLIWRERAAEQLLDPGFEEKDAVALMKTKVVPPLLEADFIGRGGSKEVPLAWVTATGA